MVNLKKEGNYISQSLPEDIKSWKVEREELTIFVEPRSIVNVLSFLRDDKSCLYKQLMDVCGVDYIDRQLRFDVVYHLLSVTYNKRVRIIVCLDEKTPIPTATSLFACADWWEREVWDMLGIIFDGHPDLRRILTDYEFEGHPLRKDFPVMGYTQVKYDKKQGKVVYEPVQLEQSFRSFDFVSPWESMTTEMKRHLCKELPKEEGQTQEREVF